MHRDVCSRLRQEVLDTFGPTGPPTYADLKQMDYCAFHVTLPPRSRFYLTRGIL